MLGTAGGGRRGRQLLLAAEEPEAAEQARPLVLLVAVAEHLERQHQPDEKEPHELGALRVEGDEADRAPRVQVEAAVRAALHRVQLGGWHLAQRVLGAEVAEDLGVGGEVLAEGACLFGELGPFEWVHHEELRGVKLRVERVLDGGVDLFSGLAREAEHEETVLEDVHLVGPLDDLTELVELVVLLDHFLETRRGGLDRVGDAVAPGSRELLEQLPVHQIAAHAVREGDREVELLLDDPVADLLRMVHLAIEDVVDDVELADAPLVVERAQLRDHVVDAAGAELFGEDRVAVRTRVRTATRREDGHVLLALADGGELGQVEVARHVDEIPRRERDSVEIEDRRTRRLEDHLAVLAVRGAEHADWVLAGEHVAKHLGGCVLSLADAERVDRLVAERLVRVRGRVRSAHCDRQHGAPTPGLPR